LNHTATAPHGAPLIQRSSLHSNHITDVFPDTLSTLNKTDEHTYSSSIHPTTHSHSYTLHPTTQQNVHRTGVPVNQPVPVQHMPNGVHVVGNVLGEMAGMDDSLSVGGGGGDGGSGGSGGPSGFPLLSQALSSDRVLPLQRENLRLVRSNNTLQKHLIAEGERMDEMERKWNAELRQWKSKHTDLQFLYAQKTRKLAKQESKIADLQQRLEQVLSDRQMYVKESIEAPSRLTSSTIQTSSFTQSTPSSNLSQSDIDQLRAHERKIAELTSQLSDARSQIETLNNDKSRLESSLASRDTEIARLSEVIESERNWDKIGVEHTLKSNAKFIKQLQNQVDYLNEQRQVWEREMKNVKTMGVSSSYIAQLDAAKTAADNARAETDRARARMEQLQTTIDEQRKELERMQEDVKGVDRTAAKRLQEKENEHQKLQEKFDALLRENESRGVQLDTLRTQLEQTKAKLPQIDVSLLQTNLKKEEQAKIALREQHNKLVRQHDELMHQYNQVTNELSHLKDSSSREISALQSDLVRAQFLNEDFQRRLKDLADARESLSEQSGVLKNRVEITERTKEGLESERDYYRNQVQNLNHTIHELKMEMTSKDDEVQRIKRAMVALEAQVSEGVAERSRLLAEQSSESNQRANLESSLTSLRTELAALQVQNQNLQSIVTERDEMLNNVADLNVTQRGLLRTNEKLKAQLDKLTKEKSTLSDRVSSLTSERDSLLTSLSSTDVQLGRIQAEVKALQQEREEKEQAYANLYHDYNDLSTQLNELKDSKLPEVTAALNAAKSENGRLQSRIQDLESNTLPSLSLNEQNQRTQIDQLNATVRDLQHRLDKEQSRSTEYEAQISELEHELGRLRQNAESKVSQLQGNAQVLAHHAELISKLNLQLSDMKSVCRSLENQKNKVEAEWRHALETIETTKKELGQQIDMNAKQSVVVQEKNQEIVELKQSMNALLENKAELEVAVTESRKRFEQLQSDIQSQSASGQMLETRLSDAAAHCAQLQDALRSKEYELNNLVQQLQEEQRQVGRLKEENTIKTHDLKAIIQDLENVLKENQLLSKEIHSLKSTSDTRSVEVERQQLRVKQLEELQKSKEMENLDLLSNYRSICAENERIKLALDELEVERRNYRSTLKSNQDSLNRTEQALKSAQDEFRRRMIDLHTHENTIQQLSRALESQKQSIERVHAEKQELQSSLDSVKQLSMGLEHARGDQVKTSAELRSQIAKLQADLHALQMDNAHLVQSLTQAREQTNNLEKVIANLRAQAANQSQQQQSTLSDKTQRMTQMQLDLQQARHQIDALNDQLQTLHQYRDKQHSEINRLLHSLATSSSSSTSPSSSPSSASSSPFSSASAEFLSQIKLLQSTIDAQFVRMQELAKEKSKYKSRWEGMAQRSTDGVTSSPKARSPTAGTPTTSSSSSSPSPPPAPSGQTQPSQSDSASTSLITSTLASPSFHVQNA